MTIVSKRKQAVVPRAPPLDMVPWPITRPRISDAHQGLQTALLSGLTGGRVCSVAQLHLFIVSG
jgi:hypothetical protein